MDEQTVSTALKGIELHRACWSGTRLQAKYEGSSILGRWRAGALSGRWIAAACGMLVFVLGPSGCSKSPTQTATEATSSIIESAKLSVAPKDASRQAQRVIETIDDRPECAAFIAQTTEAGKGSPVAAKTHLALSTARQAARDAGCVTDPAQRETSMATKASLTLFPKDASRQAQKIIATIDARPECESFIAQTHEAGKGSPAAAKTHIALSTARQAARDAGCVTAR